VQPTNQQTNDRADNDDNEYDPIITQEQVDRLDAGPPSLLLHQLAQSIDPNDELRDVFF